MVTRWLPAGAAALVLAVMSAATPLKPTSRAIGIGCVLAAFAVTAALKRADLRAHASVAAGIAAVVAAGQVAGGILYGAAAAVFMLASLFALREARRTQRVPIDARSLAVIGGVTVIVVGSSVMALPPIAARVERAVTSMMGVDGDDATAFSTTMALGSTRGMLQSSTIVLRIEGDAPDYLRGAVYDRYDGHYWINGSGRLLASVPAAGSGPRARITLDRHAPVGDDMRWFLPPGAGDFDEPVQADGFGVVRRAQGPLSLAYRPHGDAPPVMPPTPQDLEVPPHLRRALVPLARQAAGDARTDGDRLRAIERSMAGFAYSLAVERDTTRDPVIDFLTVHQAGHCEMFASAMALEARALGIPTRVVGGFRVSEMNPFTKQMVVRERNAHAWVEAWVDGAWHAYDPTPVSDAPGLRRSTWDRIVDPIGDLAALAWDRIYDFGLLGVAAVLGVLAAVLVLLRQIMRWAFGARRRRGGTASFERPLPCFETLTAALEARGFARDPSEPIEAFAARVPLSEASTALGAYAALRYGNVGDEASVARAVERAAKAVLKTPVIPAR